MAATETDRELLRQRRTDIARELSDLRNVLRDLENHPPNTDAGFEERQRHFETIQKCKARIHELDEEYVNNSVAGRASKKPLC